MSSSAMGPPPAGQPITSPSSVQSSSSSSNHTTVIAVIITVIVTTLIIGLGYFIHKKLKLKMKTKKMASPTNISYGNPLLDTSIRSHFWKHPVGTANSANGILFQKQSDASTGSFASNHDEVLKGSKHAFGPMPSKDSVLTISQPNNIAMEDKHGPLPKEMEHFNLQESQLELGSLDRLGPLGFRASSVPTTNLPPLPASNGALQKTMAGLPTHLTQIAPVATLHSSHGSEESARFSDLSFDDNFNFTFESFRQGSLEDQLFDVSLEHGPDHLLNIPSVTDSSLVPTSHSLAEHRNSINNAKLLAEAFGPPVAPVGLFSATTSTSLQTLQKSSAAGSAAFNFTSQPVPPLPLPPALVSAAILKQKTAPEVQPLVPVKSVAAAFAKKSSEVDVATPPSSSHGIVSSVPVKSVAAAFASQAHHVETPSSSYYASDIQPSVPVKIVASAFDNMQASEEAMGLSLLSSSKESTFPGETYVSEMTKFYSAQFLPSSASASGIEGSQVGIVQHAASLTAAGNPFVQSSMPLGVQLVDKVPPDLVAAPVGSLSWQISTPFNADDPALSGNATFLIAQSIAASSTGAPVVSFPQEFSKQNADAVSVPSGIATSIGENFAPAPTMSLNDPSLSIAKAPPPPPPPPLLSTKTPTSPPPPPLSPPLSSTKVATPPLPPPPPRPPSTKAPAPPPPPPLPSTKGPSQPTTSPLSNKKSPSPPPPPPLPATKGSTAPPPPPLPAIKNTSAPPPPPPPVSSKGPPPPPLPNGKGPLPPPAPGKGSTAPPPPPLPAIKNTSAPPLPPPPVPTKGPPPPPLPNGKGPPLPPPAPGKGPPPPPPGSAPRTPLPSKPPQVPQQDSTQNLQKLKPLHWDKVRADPSQSMVWDRLRTGSFELNEDEIAALFGTKPTVNKEVGKAPVPAKKKGILDSKKAQNVAIQLRALNISTQDICDGLLEGSGMKAELLEVLVKMTPTQEEQKALLDFSGDRSELGPAERFLKSVLEIPNAFQRLQAMQFKACFKDDLAAVQELLKVLEAACGEVRENRLFLKLLEAVLKTGNRMNKGTNRGEAEAFKLDTLLRLSDVKGADGKTTLLQFVAEEIIKSEGIKALRGASGGDPSNEKAPTSEVQLKEVDVKRKGLEVVWQLCIELRSVKDAAGVDADGLNQSVLKLASGLLSIQNRLKTIFQEQAQSSGIFVTEDTFSANMEAFCLQADNDIAKLKEEVTRVFDRVKKVTAYFHGTSRETQPLRLFIIVRDFLGMLEKVCRDLARPLKMNLRG